MEKSIDAFRTISEVAEDLDVPQHVLRFWETKFPQIKPMKRGGGRRYYRPDDVDLLRTIRHLLYGQGYTIRGVQRILKEQGVRATIAAHGPEASSTPTFDAPAFPTAPAPDEEDRLDEADLDPDARVDPPVAPPNGSARVAAPGLSADDRTRLEGVLADLRECQRLLHQGAA